MKTERIVYAGVNYGKTYQTSLAIFEFINKKMHEHKMAVKFEFICKASDLDDSRKLISELVKEVKNYRDLVVRMTPKDDPYANLFTLDTLNELITKSGHDLI